ncbi:deiodinase [Candidatus Poribacteria bacterium]|nr:deiodinase [Candidatus Poribacteria bacterium]
MIYIREAHPIDGWDIGSEQRIRDPQTIEERRSVARSCEAALRYGIRTYVDEMDDAVMTAYAAWPERLYLIDTNGRVAYAGGPGPYEFHPNELRTAIERLIA